MNGHIFSKHFPTRGRVESLRLAPSSGPVDSLEHSLTSLLPVPLGIMLAVCPHLLPLPLMVALLVSLSHVLQFILLFGLFGWVS